MRSGAVLFLGSGATAGSGIKKDRHSLPVDSKFFESKLVAAYLDRCYPALAVMRKHLSIEKKWSLFKTWNEVFVYRGLAWSEIIEEPEAEKLLEQLKKWDWPENREHRKGHYDAQFRISDIEQWPAGYYLGELAIWDLRTLLVDVYDGVDCERQEYEALWRRLQNRVATVVNINYDTTFDDCLRGRVEFYIPLPGPAVDERKPWLIRPHGSLHWTDSNRYLLAKPGWAPRWCWSIKTTPADQLGYREAGDGLYELKQPLIVTPATFKEEVVGNSSSPGLQNDLLRVHWASMCSRAERSSDWAFPGLSLQSGDDHLVFLLRRIYERMTARPTLHSSCYAGEHACENLRRVFGHDARVCAHDIPKDESVLAFADKPDCEIV